MSNIYKQIYNKIKKYDTIVIARHIAPDPDAIGSQIALRDCIKYTFPKKNVYAIGKSVSKFKYFGDLDKLDDNLDLSKVLLITTDVPNADRVDGPDIKLFADVIKIDHHPYETKFGETELVEGVCSACQLLIELINNTRLKINSDIAGKLFLGVVSDSDRFLLPYTSSRTFYLISKLIYEYNLDFTSLYVNLYERPMNEIKFHSYIAQNLTITDNGLGYIIIQPEIIKQFNVDGGTASNMINDFNYIKELSAWVFVTYDDGKDLYKVNIRSRGPIINKTASKYHGGGHAFASGVRTNSKEDIDNLLKDLDIVCKEYKESMLK